MSDATLIVEVQVGGQTLRLTKEDALRLWTELDDVFGWLSRVDENEPTVEPEPQAPQVVPVYVPWYPWPPSAPTPTWTQPPSPWNKEWCKENTAGDATGWRIQVGGTTVGPDVELLARGCAYGP
jgi:hypothetical protein